MAKDILRNQLQESATLRDVMERLNSGIFGVVFIIDNNSRVIGIFTDGDVRRAVLGGASLDDAANLYMNTEFVSGRADASHAENISLLTERVRHVPIMDADGRLVELLSWAEMLRLPLMEPALGGNELKYLTDCIVSGWISSQGEYVRQFERTFSEQQGEGTISIAVSSGTTALHLALKAIGICPGDEVIVPNLTFAATANVVLHCGAKPICVDVDVETWTMESGAVKRAITDRTRAIIPVHLYGHPCDMDPLMELANVYSLKVIEDCAEAQGATYKGKPVGSIGHVGCFSFFSNKVITTGEGGMLVTSDPNIAERCILLRDHGMSPARRYWHDVAGFNYRMTNLQAAVGVAQMERLDKFLKRRREIGHLYIDGLKGIPGLTMPPCMKWADTVFWIFSMLVDEKMTGISRDNLARYMGDKGIDTRPFFFPLNIQKPYKQDGEYEVSERLARQGISLPSGNEITNESIDRVCNTIREAICDKKAA